MCDHLRQSDHPELQKFGGENNEAWFSFGNEEEMYEAALQLVLERAKLFPDEPILITGYSKGGHSAMKLAHDLYKLDPSIRIEALILIDPEPGPEWMPRTVPENVDRALHYFTTGTDPRFDPFISPRSVHYTAGSSLTNLGVRAVRGYRDYQGDGTLSSNNISGLLYKVGEYVAGPVISDGVDYIYGARNVNYPDAHHYNVFFPSLTVTANFLIREGMFAEE